MSSQFSIDSLKQLINKEDKIIYLVGAGISMEPPSSIPSAIQFSRILLNFSVPKDEVDTILSLPGMRYEMVVERIKRNYDKTLEFLNYLELITSPNIIHLFLGHEICNKHPVITTNFDFLIEHALREILPKEEHPNIFPVITKEDYLYHQNHLELYNKNKYPLYKIHGTKKNIISGEDTTKSLITTISSLGMNREQGETFAIEPFKKDTINDLLRNANLIVMGYSGSDTFDIGPLLQNFPSLNKILWIEHSFEDDILITEILPNNEIPLNSPSTCEQLLYGIRNSNDYQIFKIKTNTMEFVSNVLSKILLAPDEALNAKEKESGREDFENWVRSIFNEVKESKKYFVASKIYYDLGKFEDLFNCAQKGLSLANNEGDQEFIAKFLNFLGIYQSERGIYDKALKMFQKAVKIDGELNKKYELGNGLTNIGDVYLKKGEFQEALNHYDKARNIFEEINNFRGLANVLSNMGWVYEELAQIDEALESYKTSLQLEEKIGNLTGKASRLTNIGELFHMKLGDLENALIYHQEALKINIELGKLSGLPVNYSNIATIYADQGNFSMAYELYDKALKIFKDMSNLDGISIVKSNLADIKEQEGNLTEAIDLIREALDINEKLNDFRKKTENLIELGKLLIKKGEFNSALPLFQEAHSISLEKDYKYTATSSLYNLAETYRFVERFNDAIETYEKAIKLAEKYDNNESKVKYLNNLALIYEDMGDFKLALRFYQEALNTNESIEDNNNNKLITIENMAGAFKKSGEIDLALKYYQKALNVVQELENKEDIGYYLLEISSILLEQKKFIEAFDKYAEALKIYKEIKDWYNMQAVLGSLGYCSVALNDYENAKIFCEKSLAIAKKLNLENDIQTQEENLVFINKKLEEKDS